MREPNLELFVYWLFIRYIVNALLLMLLGAVGADRPEEYNTWDIVQGAIALVIVLIIWLW